MMLVMLLLHYMWIFIRLISNEGLDHVTMIRQIVKL